MSIVDEHEHALTVADRLPADMMLLKMENESIMSVARAMPRDPMKIVGQLQQLIDAYPAAADEAIYSKPVGTVIEVTCGACGVKYEVNRVERETVCPGCDSGKIGPTRKIKKFAEGLSIRAAESIRSIYGYTRLATTTEILEDGRAKLTGILVDYAAGNVTSDERIVSPFYKSRTGQMARTPEDRFLNVVIKAEKAKLRRDVILDNTPNMVKAMFRDACEQKLLGLVAPEVIEQKIIPAFAEHGITPEQLDRIIGRPHSLGWRESERLELRKILTALKNGETTRAELLADLEEPEEKKGATAPQTGGATMADLTGETAVVSPKPEPEKTPAEDYEAARTAYLVALVDAKTYKACDEAVAAHSPNLPAPAQAWIAHLCEARKAEIKASRGEGSNKPRDGADQAKLIAAFKARIAGGKGFPIAMGNIRDEIEADPAFEALPAEVSEELRGMMGA